MIVPVYINEANLNKPLLTIWTKRPVGHGEELCFSYHGDGLESGSEDDGDEVRALHPPLIIRC